MVDAIQPGLRSFIVYDRLPDGCTAMEIRGDDCLPHIRSGEFAVIDTTDREPINGELFALRYSRGEPVVAQLSLREIRPTEAGGGPIACWWAVSCNRPRSHAERMAWGRSGRSIPMADGPYGADADGLEYLASKLVGRVVGIYAPDFRAVLTERA